MNPEFVTALSGGITLILGTTFFYFPWQTLVIDQTRQRLFEIRDDWFDYTHTLQSQADRKAAEQVRVEINYLIRLTHKVTFPVLLFAGIGHFLFNRSHRFEHPLDYLLRGFRDQEAAKRARKTVMDAFQIVTWGMIRRSIPAMVFAIVAVVLSLIIYATHRGVVNRANQLDPLIQSLGKRSDLAAQA